MINRSKLKERYAAFRQWQKTPHVVAPMSSGEHDCPTCHTHYTGNFCPRCGQSSKIGRFSFKKALLLYIDVWGLGNRGMFHTLRDLILRPGYMIRDYLNGMQMAYFPPFKLFFLLATLSFLIGSGLNIKLQNTLSNQEVIESQDNNEEYTDDISFVAKSDSTIIAVGKEEIQELQNEETNEKIEKTKEQAKRITQLFDTFYKKFPNIFALFWLLVLSFFFFLFYRKCPAYPNMHYSELVVAMIYTSNMYSIYSNISDFLCIDNPGVNICLLLLNLVPLHQLSGYSWKKLILITLLAMAMLFVSIVALVVLGLILANFI